MTSKTTHHRGVDDLDAGFRRPGKLLAWAVMALIVVGVWLGGASAVYGQEATPPTVYSWQNVTGDIVRPAIVLRGRETPAEVLAQARERWGDPATAELDQCVMFAPWGNVARVDFDWSGNGFANHVKDGRMSGWDFLVDWWPGVVEALDRAGYRVTFLALDIESGRADTWGGDSPRIAAALEAGTPGLPDIDPGLIRTWPPTPKMRAAVNEWNQWAADREAAAWRRLLLAPARDAWGESVRMSQYAWTRHRGNTDARGWHRPAVAADGITGSPVLYGPAEDAIAWFDDSHGDIADVAPWICGPGFTSEEHCRAVYGGLKERGTETYLLWDKDEASSKAADKILVEVHGAAK